MVKKKIVRYETKETSFPDDISIHPVLKRIYTHRGIRSPDQLDITLKSLLPFKDLKGIDAVTTLLCDILSRQQNIIVIGDYDVDGATSTALMVLALRALGAKHVDYLVPDRFIYGYGLTPDIVTLAIQQKPDVIITVDNGISSIKGVEAANAAGIKVIITDHHLSSGKLPNAAAIVNPNQPQDPFSSKNLAGVGVAFYVLLALRAKLREQNWFSDQNISEPNLATYLDLVALGTISDLVPMDKNNRILVQQGLKRIQAEKCRPGIIALAEIANRSLHKMTASDLSYAISPRLNAAGRLDDMTIGISCLLAEDFDEAKRIAYQLNSFNQERKTIEDGMRQEALQTLKKIDLNQQKLPKGLCLLNDDWHEGVVGILASRIKDRLHRPTIIFAKHGEDELKGSARSIDGLHIRDVIGAIATDYPGLIVKFGGHAAAAGLTLTKKSYDLFARLFNEEVSRRLEGKDLSSYLMSDGELTDSDFCVELAELLREASPWGQKFPVPLFDGKFRILEQRLLSQKHLKLTVKSGNQSLEAIAFNTDTDIWPNEQCEFIHMAYRLDINEYLGRKKVNLIVEYMEPI